MSDRVGMKPSLLTLLSLLTLALAPPVVATDGVIEISQAKVLAGGGHFPYNINATGSYRLTSNLDVTNDPGNATAVQDRTAIQFNAGGAYSTLDLNGFAILGPTACSGGPPVTTCTPIGSTGGYGILVGAEGVRVSNGTIKGMGGDGVAWNGSFCRFDHLRIIGNGDTGMSAPAVTNAVITNNIVANNYNGGISINLGGLIVENEVYGNRNGGIVATRSTIVRNTVLSNGGGISGSSGIALENLVHGNASGVYTSVAALNLSSTNTGSGIRLGSGGVAAFNSSTSNTGATGYGIQSLTGGASLFGNAAYGNAHEGLFLTSGATGDAFAENVLENNNASAGQSAGGVQMGTNICKGTTTCP